MTRPKTNTKVNGNKYFRLRKTIDGVQKSFYGRTKAEAEKKYIDYLEDRHTDACSKPQSPVTATFRSQARNYITNVLKPSQKYATATKERYTMAYDVHIKGTWLDRMRVCDIRAYDIQRFYNELPVSKQTLATVNKFLAGFNRWLILNKCSEDFLTAVEIPMKPENKRHEGVLVWEEDEIQTILSNLDGHRLKFLIYILLYTGARISEAIALRHDDIRDGTVHIERQCYCGEIKKPKYNSVRQIPLHKELLEAYKEHIEWQKKDMEKHRYNTDLIFTASTGNMYDPTDLRKRLKRFYQSHGIPNKSPHTYRATFCTGLCRSGVPIEVASKLMGHKSIEVTALHYTRVSASSQAEAINLLNYSVVTKKDNSRK